MSFFKQKVSASQNSGEFEMPPTGTHAARLVAVIDLGTQRHEYQGDASWRRDVYWVWELVNKPKESDPKSNHVIGLDMTFSFNEKAKMRGFIEARRGKRIAVGDEVDVAGELGQAVLLTIGETSGGYPKVKNVSPMPDGMEAKPAKLQQVAIDIDAFKSGAVIPLYVPWLYGTPIPDVIKRAKEFGGTGEVKSEYAEPAMATEDDQIPF